MKKEKGKTMSIQFTKKILDNVHGFIPYTEEEEKIINLPLFVDYKALNN